MSAKRLRPKLTNEVEKMTQEEEIKELKAIVLLVSDAFDNNNVPNGWLHGQPYVVPGKFVTPLLDRLTKYWGFDRFWCDKYPRPWENIS